MTDIFLSYQSADRERARLVAQALESIGWSVFWDRKTPPGESWDDYLGRKLEEASCVVVLWSSAAVKSGWVKEEAHHGKDERILVPAMIERDVKPPFGFRRAHAADLTEWDGSPEATPFRELVRGIESKVPIPARGEEAGEGVESGPAAEVAPVAETPPPSAAPASGLIAGVEFCPVPAGAFRMGEGEEEQEVTLPEFRISRHPITTAQYADFVEGGGYEKRDYWREADAAGFWEDGRFKGQFDKKARTGPVAYAGSANPDHPVVGVTWYEALAYTRWLTEVARDAGDLPKGEVVTLPSEAEWEKAARGEDAREYPWGDEFEPDRCNVEESRIGYTSPVGSYPTGASPFGVEDMAGNVLGMDAESLPRLSLQAGGRPRGLRRRPRREPRAAWRLLRQLC